ncbi:hypothetical protein PVAG01_08071 [Phlyctema vagabunda]|uniref:Uncharacterized protein n=1 Tax=Phlyctema vagabunda TaxID=108571 RepID=A0ABR4P8F0_9HELO
MKADDFCAQPKLSSTNRNSTSDSPISSPESDSSDGYDDIETQSNRSVGEVENGNSQQSALRISVWIASSVTALCSSKQLMANYGYHYPLTIAFRSSAITSLAYLLFLYAPMVTSWRIGFHQAEQSLVPSLRWLPMLPAALMAAISLPMLLEGLLHMPSLPVLVMLFPLVYVIESLIVFVTCSRSRTRLCLPLETILAIIPLSVILYDEYRLTVQGLIWGLVGIIAMGLARGLFVAGSDRTSAWQPIETRGETYHGFVSMTLMIGTSLGGILSYAYETYQPIKTVHTSSSTLGFNFINMISMVTTAFSGSLMMAYSPMSFEHEFTPSSIPVANTNLLATTASSLMVFLLAIFSSPTTVVSWVQINAYIVAILCLAGIKNISEGVKISIDFIQSHVKTLGLREWRSPSKIFINITLLTLIGVATFTLNIISGIPIQLITNTTEPTLDLSFNPVTRFEIVIAMYEEPVTAVASLIDDLMHTMYLSSLSREQITTTIYIKSSTYDPDELKIATGADQALKLPNLGREGGTYLHHIVNNWDRLAEQTMFIQAGAHNKRELLPRINDYMNVEIGMLNLGEAGIVCDCLTCNDRTGWQDSWNMLPKLYSEVHHNKTCTPSTKVALSYKGQFIASARRIRGVKKQVYVQLLDAITSTDGWSHDRDIIGSRFDSPDNPFFGFTLERVWGLIMQCADKDVAVQCPSLLSGTLGYRRGGGVEDCGCFD